jgi:hypothetical protein
MGRSRFRALGLAGLLGLAVAAAPALAADPPCPPARPLDSASPAGQLAKCFGGFGERQRVVAAFQERLGLSGDAAARLADALAAHQNLEKREDWFERTFFQEIRRIESEFIALLQQAPENPAIAAEVSWFYRYWSDSLGTPAPALLALVARDRDSAGLALRLTQKTEANEGAQILVAALAVRPQAVVLWVEAARNLPDASPWKVAFLEEAYRRLMAGGRKRPADVTVATALAEELLEKELEAGLVPQAIAAFQGLITDHRSLFTALRSEHRVIVLTPEEMDSAQKKLGVFNGESLELFFFDRSGRRGYVTWNSRFGGGHSFLNENEDGTWKVDDVLEWFS